MTQPKTQTTLEERVERIEKHLQKKHWLDEDSGYTLDLNNPWPERIGTMLAIVFFMSIGFIVFR